MGDPEIVFIFVTRIFKRLPNMDVRPKFVDDYRIKFKAEALPLKDQIWELSSARLAQRTVPFESGARGDRTSMKTLSRVFPVLETIKTSDADKVELVNATAVEEVLLDIGLLDFGKGVTAKANAGSLANLRRPETARRRIRVSMQVQAPGRTPRRHPEALRTVLLLSPAKCAGLDLPRNDQNRDQFIGSRRFFLRPTNDPLAGVELVNDPTAHRSIRLH